MTVISNGTVVLPDALLEHHDVYVEDERIAEIRPAGGPTPEGARFIDAGEGFVMPGFIDIHADYIEHMAAPRPTTVMDFRMSLHEAERELVAHGITTMFHSLSFYKYTEFLPSPIRSPENTVRFVRLIHSSHHADHLIRHRFHARFEVDSLDRVEELNAYIDEGMVHLISFMDHTPGQGQYRDLVTYRETLKSYRDVSDEEIDTIIERSRSREKLTIAHMAKIAERARARRIAVASHDDDSLGKVSLVRELGATICEFPTAIEVAREARRLGMHTVAGAPNVLLGGSHSGNLSATEAILEDCIDTLCSDYYPPSLLHAIFTLHDRHGLPLPRAVRLVTLNPARAVMTDDELGSIEKGKRADLLVVKRIDGGLPAVTTAMVNGRPVMSVEYRIR